MPQQATKSLSPWPFRMALLLCCATFPLIWVGGLVTTYDAGMAVPDWPSTYGYNMLEYPISTWISGPFDLFVEHGHRLLGAFTGMLTIALVVVTWRCDQRPFVRWFSVACLVAVIVQGLIGGARVIANEVLLARLHGCTGPLFFCMTLAMTFFTSRRYRTLQASPSSENASLFRVAAMLTLIAYGQLVLGSFLRHVPAMTTPNEFRGLVFAHVLTALGVAAYSFTLWRAARKSGTRSVLSFSKFVTLLVLCQIGLGIGTWLVKYNWPTWLPAVQALDRFVIQDKGLAQGLVTTAHVAMGSLILAAAFAMSLVCYPALRQYRLSQAHIAPSREDASTRSSIRMEVMA